MERDEKMEIDPIIPIIVAIIGAFQVAISLYAGRKQTQAAAAKDLGDSYATLIETLETRLSNLEDDYKELCKKRDQLQEEHLILKEDYEELKRNCRKVLAAKEDLEERMQDLSDKVDNGNSK